MPIEFQQFPASWRLPLYWVEVDSSQAGTGVNVLPALLVGQKHSAGTAPFDTPVPCGTLQNAQQLFGIGSPLERMFNRFFANNSAQEIWCIAVTPPAGGAASTGTITVSSAPTAAGTLQLYIAGQVIPIGVGASDTENTVAANIVTAINAMPTLPVHAALASSGSSIVDLTSHVIGVIANDIDMRDNYLGTLGGEVMPLGLALTYSGTSINQSVGGKMAGASGVPNFANAITNLGDNLYEYVALPYTDTGSLEAWQTEYGFTSSGRWGWMRQLYGQLYGARRDTYGNLLIWGATQNFPECVMGFEIDSPSPVWEWSAAFCAEAALGFSNDPARPLQTLELLGIQPATKAFRFLLTENNLLASTGIATQHVDSSNAVAILRETTTYQVNAFGSPDIAYTDMTTLATLSALLRNQRASITSKFPRYKLADDGTLFGPGQAIVTPSIIKAELVAEYANDEFNGLVEDTAVFAKNLLVERDSRNPDRVNVLYPPNLIGQLRIFAVLAQFRLLSAQQTTAPQS